ncbi:hypothetical protein [Gordonia malaquae]|uniref:hypothetical protein n=1 Tax=Gordonia malaquae TaxID=410332 RepID=UPI0030180CAB
MASNARDELDRLANMSLDDDVDIDSMFADYDRARARERVERERAADAAAAAAADAVPLVGSVEAAERAAARRARSRMEHVGVAGADELDDEIELDVPALVSLGEDPVSTDDRPRHDERDDAHEGDSVEVSTDGVMRAQPPAPTPPAPTPPAPVGFTVSDDFVANMFTSALANQGSEVDSPAEPTPVTPLPASTGDRIPTITEPSSSATQREESAPRAAAPVAPEHAPARPEPAAVDASAAASSAVPDESAVRAENGASDADSARRPGGKEVAAEKAQKAWGAFRRQPMLYQIGGACVVVLVLLFGVSKCFGGGGEETPDSEPIGGEVVTAVETPSQETTSSTAGVLVPDSVESDCPAGSTRPELAFTSEKRDAWVCTRANGIDGALMTITFQRPVVINEIEVTPGYNYVESSGIDQWTRHRVVTRILWRIGDEQMVQQINPVRTGARLKVNAIATQTVTLMVQSTAEPGKGARSGSLPTASRGKDDSFAMSSIVITGREA